MRVAALLAPRRAVRTTASLLTGHFAFIGLGDGGDDRPELIAIFETMTIVVALLVGMLYGMFAHAADTAGTSNWYAAGVGTAYFTMADVTLCGMMAVLLMSMVMMITLHNIPTAAEGRYFIAAARKELALPMIIMAALVVVACMNVVLESGIRCLGLDRKGGGVGDFLSRTVGPVPTQLHTNEDAASAANEPLEWRQYLGPDGVDALPAFNGGLFLAAGGFLLSGTATLVFMYCVVTKMMHVRALFNAEDSHEAATELEAVAGANDTPWFSRPPASALRAYLSEYVAFANRRKLGVMASPEHYLEYVLRKERAKGHGDLAYVTRKMCDNMCACRPCVPRAPRMRPDWRVRCPHVRGHFVPLARSFDEYINNQLSAEGVKVDKDEAFIGDEQPRFELTPTQVNSVSDEPTTDRL